MDNSEPQEVIQDEERLGQLRKYKKHTKHARKMPNNHEVSERNKYWEADIKFIPTEKDGYVPMIDIIDVRDRAIVGTHLGQKSKSKNFIEHDVSFPLLPSDNATQVIKMRGIERI